METKNQATNAKQEVKKLPVASETAKPKIDPVKQENEIKALLNPTAEQRLKNLKNMHLLSERFESLKKKQDELNAFSITSDGSKDHFVLSNSSGAEFEFTNSQVIEDVIEVVRKHIHVRLDRTEKEILAFVI